MNWGEGRCWSGWVLLVERGVVTGGGSCLRRNDGEGAQE